jgi:hypothetical protein
MPDTSNLTEVRKEIATISLVKITPGMIHLPQKNKQLLTLRNKRLMGRIHLKLIEVTLSEVILEILLKNETLNLRKNLLIVIAKVRDRSRLDILLVDLVIFQIQ